MAKQTVVIDDITQDTGAREVIFALDGYEYAIDLNDKHLEALKHALHPYIAAATPLGRVIKSSTVRKPKAPREGPDPRVVREWALKHGKEVAARGRLSQEIVDAYLASLVKRTKAHA